MYEYTTEKFSGPIEKLLELIEEKKLEITDLSLAEITADFLEYVKKIEAIEPRLLADFVAVAASLLLIKSKSLLPDLKLTTDEEENIRDLEGRLDFYRNFKPAMAHIKRLAQEKNVEISRPLFFCRPEVFYPSPKITIENLLKAAEKVLEAIREMPEEQKIERSLVTLEEKIEEIVARLKAELEHSTSFGSLLKDKPRSEVVVLFLALLHLLAGQKISVQQNKGFSDILIEQK
ncbi:MAG: segregation/condensation protein A [Candidatus Paceibacterota bacterium]